MGTRSRRAFVAGTLGLAAIVAALAVSTAGPLSASAPATDWSPGLGWILQTEGAAARAEQQSGSQAGPAARASLEGPAGAWFARGAVTGTPGRMVVVRIGGIETPPLRLDSARQAFGVSGDSGSAGQLEVLVETVGTWANGDSITAQDVVIQQSGPTTTFVGEGRQIMLHPSGGSPQPFVAKGYNYTSLPIGGQPLYAQALGDAATCQRDARLFGASGVTALRVLIPIIEHVSQADVRGCMDAFHANGISVAWLEQGPTEASTVIDTPEWIELWKQKMTPAIDLVAPHPASAFWVIGNEVEIQSPGSGPVWYGSDQGEQGLLEQLAAYTRQRDPNHLVGTSIAGPNTTLIQNSNVPSLGFFGVNMYPRPGQSLANLATAMNSADPRPKIVTEIGTDRLRCLRGVDSEISEDLSSLLSATPAWRTYACAEGSGDDVAAHAAQATWNGGVWDELSNYFATPSQVNGAFSGALYFMSTDWWWFNILTNGIGTSHTHETQGFAFQMADNNFNPEFAGSMYAQLPGATDPRQTSLAFDAMGARWATTAPPTITAPSVTVTGCNATVRWTSSEPTASEVQLAVDGADPLLTVDNTIFQQAAFNPTQVTQHAVTVALTPLLPHRLAGRSVAADGRHATTGPLMVAGCVGL